MRLFLHLFLLINLLTLSACTTNRPAGTNVIPDHLTTAENLYFSDLKTDYLYKMRMEIYGHNLSGLLIIKKISPEKHRVVLTTDFGNKMLDFEISQSEFQMHYAAPAMDRKVVRKILEQDFRLLLTPKFYIQTSVDDTEQSIYTAAQNGRTVNLYYNSEGLLTNLQQLRRGKEQLVFSFEGKSPIFADAVQLIHKDISLQIELTHITGDSQ
ncbi:hypothetical protein [Chryseobacterium sp. MFBS3-17]|uniref:hypothetical protein n=1 Tax=Chryseobacterium sp. MFBS3-17 TaxID=2886689 RepID=UPI001D0F2EF6|nr:hypothetical protein [Chryseobacterium sp. MFBS3-17]MCC2591312.1 hypothetical protein [Chryseobacterium sp. MFBS3-17]